MSKPKNEKAFPPFLERPASLLRALVESGLVILDDMHPTAERHATNGLFFTPVVRRGGRVIWKGRGCSGLDADTARSIARKAAVRLSLTVLVGDGDALTWRLPRSSRGASLWWQTFELADAELDTLPSSARVECRETGELLTVRELRARYANMKPRTIIQDDDGTRTGPKRLRRAVAPEVA